MVRSSDRVSILSRAIVKRPELAAAMIEANDAHNHNAGADRVMGMLLNHLIGFQLAEETLGDREWLLLDEGPAQPGHQPVRRRVRCRPLQSRARPLP